MPDEHYHEIPLPDGSTIRTGPPVGETEEEAEPGEPAAPEVPAPPPVPPKRAKAAADPAQIRRAIAARSLDGLPEYGRYVFGSMHSSTLQQFGKSYGDRAEAYASGVAWRAVGQAYGLAEPSVKSRGLSAAWPGLRPLVAQPAHGPSRSEAGKAVGVGGVTTDGGTWVVRVSGSRGAEKFYTRTLQVPVPGSGGVVVTVGISRPGSRHQILDVRIPKRLVSDTPGGKDAYGWVLENMDQLRAITSRAIGPFFPSGVEVAKRADNGRLTWRGREAWSPPEAQISVRRVEGAKFVTSPELATERITYDVVYPAWRVDLQGQYATADQVRRMAHGFMRQKGGTNLMHVTGLRMSDGKPAGTFVESYVTGWGDPNFPPDAWVGGVEWHPEAWKRIVTRELTGYSIEGAWGIVPLELVPEFQEAA